MAAGKLRTYRALARGECPLGYWRKPGEEFETAEPKARWMEDITPEEPKKAPAKKED